MAALACGFCAHAAPTTPPSDPYAALKVFGGNWVGVGADGKVTPVENRCAQTGLFFVCEQIASGKAQGLIVFKPDGPTAKGEAYIVQTLDTVGRPPGPWRALTIEGTRWTFTNADPPGAKSVKERTVNEYLGPDHIHYEVQQSETGKEWTTIRSGDERRAP